MSFSLHLVDQIYSLFQKGPLTQYAEEFQELASAVFLEGDLLMTIFHGGLYEPLYSLMPWDTNNCSLEQYILYALLLSRSAYKMPYPLSSSPEPSTVPEFTNLFQPQKFSVTSPPQSQSSALSPFQPQSLHWSPLLPLNLHQSPLVQVR